MQVALLASRLKSDLVLSSTGLTGDGVPAITFHLGWDVGGRRVPHHRL